MDKNEILNNLKNRMQKAISNLEKDLKGIRTGRASPNLLEPIMVEAYGGTMPLSQVGTVSAADSRLLTVQVWDKSMVKSVEKAIAQSNLNLNANSEGQIVRVPIPALSEERRKDLAKQAAKYGENTKVSIRNARRDGMDEAKLLEKNSEVSKDEYHSLNDEIQKITDDFISVVSKKVTSKEKDILTV